VQRVIAANFQEQSPMALDHEILTVKEVSEILQIDKSTLYKLLKEGMIPAFRIGSEWRFRADEIAGWMAEKD
jgi:excisionase family DNA binding protein